MTKPRTPKTKKTDQTTERSKFAGIPSFLLGTITGAILGLFVVSWFVQFLPGPHIEAVVQGARGTSGSILGCTYYTFAIRTGEEPVEYVYAKFQFPHQTGTFKVGLPMTANVPEQGLIAGQSWEFGKDSKGMCAVLSAGIDNSADVQAAAVGNAIAIHASKLPPNSIIMGAVATADDQSAINPTPKLATEGAYEYQKLGQTVRKPFTIANHGVSEMK